ncbi:XRE family transcriptional regulator [Bacillus sp. C1-1]|nr:XRE family transcriptional regulator [Bacillus sp. C1-1]
MADLQQLVGSNIRSIRKAKNLTQQELAERSNLIDSYIGGVERGQRNISLQTLEKIIVGLEIDAADLLVSDDVQFGDNESLRQTVINEFVAGTSQLSNEQLTSLRRIMNELFQTYK